MLDSVSVQLSARKQDYDDQANFGIAQWPFSLKLLWAPIVDSFFSRRIGRRKSWFLSLLNPCSPIIPNNSIYSLSLRTQHAVATSSVVIKGRIRISG